MNALSILVLIFAVLGAVDYVFGSRFGIGREFERGFMMLGVMALSMIGMLVLAPLLAELMRPAFDLLANMLHLDPSILPASLLANDMGGAPLSTEVARDADIGQFNALVVSSMMGCTVSFTIPFALGVVKREQHRPLLLGLLCGLATVPIGCFVGGLVCRLPLGALLLNLLPLTLLSGVIVAGLLLFPNACVKVFGTFGFWIKALIVVGLLLGMVEFLAGREFIPALAPIEDGALVCLNASIVLAGMFPLISLISRLLSRPLRRLSGVLGINETSAVCIVSLLATSATAFGMMDRMDRKGVMLNAAFAVSGAFTLGSHLAFTMAYDADYLVPVVVGKLTAGVLALLLAWLLCDKLDRPEKAS